MNVGRLAARVLIGGPFIGHGTQKLLGWFGGSVVRAVGHPRDDGLGGMHPPRRNALAAGLSETGGGALLVLGLATPLASASLIGVMVTAIRTVHLPHGPWSANGGWEYNAVLIGTLMTLTEAGLGPVSLDRRLGQDRSGALWGLGALALGAAASTAAINAGRRAAPAATPAASVTPTPTAVNDPSGVRTPRAPPRPATDPMPPSLQRRAGPPALDLITTIGSQDSYLAVVSPCAPTAPRTPPWSNAAVLAHPSRSSASDNVHRQHQRPPLPSGAFSCVAQSSLTKRRTFRGSRRTEDRTTGRCGRGPTASHPSKRARMTTLSAWKTLVRCMIRKTSGLRWGRFRTRRTPSRTS